MTEWLELMLDEVRRKKAEVAEALAEDEHCGERKNKEKPVPELNPGHS
jgi:hypothetical protein